MIECEFLFDNQLIAELESLIKNAKHKLVLISPFIDLDERIKSALNSHKGKHDFQLTVLFGKNEDNFYKSAKKDSLEFFKEFPNIEIYYEERLHAKFYQNDFDYIMTSLNLYDYSLKNNIEVGIKVNYASKGLIGKVFDGTDQLINQGVGKVKHDVMGMQKEIDPMEKFQLILGQSKLKYKTSPTFETKNGALAILSGKKMNGFNVEINLLSESNPIIKPTEYNQATTTFSNQTPSSKTLSGTQLSKAIGISLAEFNELMQKEGFILGDKITALGSSKGLVSKTYMNKEYTAYPENIMEIVPIKK